MRVISTIVVGFYMCTAIGAQDKPSWVSDLEVVLAKQQPEWTISDNDVNGVPGYFTQVLKLRSKGLRVEINIAVSKSPNEAKEEFEGQKIAFTNILQTTAIKSTLDGLGDENFMFTDRGKVKTANVFLLQGNVVVKVFAPSAEIAKRFTKYVVDLIPHRTSA